ncbi:MAG: DMT family transporter [Burkholderiales bacterium]|nr:DMT family transporter [Burkholderiales bacterium]
MLQSLWMLVAAFFFAVMSAFVKFSSSDAGTFEIVFYRSLIGLIVVFTMMQIAGMSIRTSHLKGNLKRSILGTLSFTMWFATLAHLPLGTATTLNYTSPLFVACVLIVIALWKKEKAPWFLGLAIVCGFIGVCLVLQPSVSNEQLPWAFLGLCSGALGPIIFFQIKELGAMKEPSWRIVFYFSLVGTVWGLIGALLFEGGLSFHNDWRSWIGLIGVGVCAVIGQICLTKAYAYGNMMLTACFQFATIPFAELISYFIFKESLPGSALLGMAFIFVAGTAASIITKKMEVKNARSKKKGLRTKHKELLPS